MVEHMDKALDDALGGLAREMRDAAPLPGPDLTARVLADAAAVAAAKAPVEARPAPAGAGGAGVLERLFGWTSGALAAMAVCMSVGIAVGMEIDAADLPMMGETEPEMIDPMSSPEESPFGSEGFL